MHAVSLGNLIRVLVARVRAGGEVTTLPFLPIQMLVRHGQFNVYNIKKSVIGRPRVDAVRVLVRIPPDQIAVIDAYTKGRTGEKPSRQEAIHRSVEIVSKANGTGSGMS